VNGLCLFASLTILGRLGVVGRRGVVDSSSSFLLSTAVGRKMRKALLVFLEAVSKRVAVRPKVLIVGEVLQCMISYIYRCTMYIFSSWTF